MDLIHIIKKVLCFNLKSDLKKIIYEKHLKSNEILNNKVIQMSLVFSKQVNQQISEISKLENLNIDFTALIGYFDSKNNKINIISCIHLPKKHSISNDSFLNDQDINHLNSFDNLLPYPLSIIGIIFYSNEDITAFSLKKIFEIIGDNLRILTIGNKTVDDLSFYTLTKEKIVKLKYEEKDITIQKIIQLIHTIEFECS